MVYVYNIKLKQTTKTRDMIKPVFNMVTVDHHLSRRVKKKEAREAKCLYITPLGYFINMFKGERVICLN